MESRKNASHGDSQKQKLRLKKFESQLSRAVAYELELFLEPFEPKNCVPATLKWRIVVYKFKHLQNGGSLSKNRASFRSNTGSLSPGGFSGLVHIGNPTVVSGQGRFEF